MKLKELFTFLPKIDKPASHGKENGMYPFFTSSNVINKYVDEADYSGEFLIIGDGGTGNCKYYNGSFSASDHNYVLKPINHNNTRLIRYFLMKDDYKVLNDGFKGVGIKNISKSYIGEIEYFKNSKYSDEFAVDSLDHINGEIDKLNNELFLFDELIKSRFIEMFGTLNSPKFAFNYDVLENVCHKITDGKHGGCTFVKGTKKYFVGAREIYNDKINYETAPEISQDEFEKDYKRCNLQVNDFIIVNTGATIGKSAIVKDERAKDTLLQKSVALIKVREDILNNIFLKYCYIVNPEMYIVESGSAQPNLLLSKIKSTKIYIPNINMQNEFACFVEQIDKLKFNVQKQIKYYQELLDLKMHEYFDVEEED